MLSVNSYMWGHRLEHSRLTKGHTLKKMDSPYPRHHPLSIAPQLRWGLMSPSPLHIGMLTSFILDSYFVGKQLLWVHEWIVCHVQKTLLCTCPLQPLAPTIFLPPVPWWSCSLRDRGYRHPFTSEHSIDTYPLSLDRLWASAFTMPMAQRSFSIEFWEQP